MFRLKVNVKRGRALTIVCKSANHANNESPSPDGLAPAIGPVVGVFPEHTSVLFVNANHVLDHEGTSIVSDKRSGLSRKPNQSTVTKGWPDNLTYHIMNLPKAITSKGELVRHRAHTVFAPKAKFDYAMMS
jgi:hypothetical protein